MLRINHYAFRDKHGGTFTTLHSVILLIILCCEEASRPHINLFEWRPPVWSSGNQAMVTDNFPHGKNVLRLPIPLRSRNSSEQALTTPSAETSRYTWEVLHHQFTRLRMQQFSSRSTILYTVNSTIKLFNNLKMELPYLESPGQSNKSLSTPTIPLKYLDSWFKIQKCGSFDRLQQRCSWQGLVTNDGFSIAWEDHQLWLQSNLLRCSFVTSLQGRNNHASGTTLLNNTICIW